MKAPARFVPQETVSPFVYAEDEGRIPLDLLSQPEVPSLLVDLLARPSAIVERVAAEEDREALISGSAIATLGSLLVIALAARIHISAAEALRAGALVGFAELLAVASALGPIYAVGAIVAARLPARRLIPSVLSAVASGSLLLIPLAPFVWLAFAKDPLWQGPLALVGAFLVAALAGGRRLYTVLIGLGERCAGGSMTPLQRFRVRIVARMAMTSLAFTLALGFWGFDALG